MKLEQVKQDLKALKLQNWRPVWEPFMKKYNCNFVCELGIFKGENFMSMIAHKPKLAVAVDTWNNDGVHSPSDGSYTKAELNNQYQYFRSQVEDLPNIQILKEDTAEAALYFRNNYFDFVYVDADASFEGCYRNLTKWYPKVRYGKFLMGRNYTRGSSVAQAVDKFVKEKKLALLWRTPSIWAVVKT